MKEKDLMKKAFILARKGRGLTGLNPMVGAILLKSDKIIGKGFHQKYGGPHAEVNAINDAELKGISVKGATLVTTLEPCCHRKKKTPPCTNIIINKGIKKVYYGSIDMNPQVQGRGIEKLKSSNIKTVFVDSQKNNDQLNRGFLKITQKKLPYVTLKICMTLDGMIFNKKSCSSSIGDLKQLKDSNNLRANYDSILVGVETIIADNPQLTYRGTGDKNLWQPRPIVLDSSLRTPLDSKIIKLKNNPIIFTKLSENSNKSIKLRNLGCTIIKLKNLEPKTVLKSLVKNNVQTVLVEGGGSIFSSFLKSNVGDQLILYYSSIFMGNSGLNIGHNLDRQYKLKKNITKIKKIGNSTMMVFES